MWVQNEIYGVYWVSRDASDPPKKGVRPPLQFAVEVRELNPEDVIFAVEMYTNEEGVRRGFNWITNIFFNAPSSKSKTPFPTKVSYKAIDSWFKSAAKESVLLLEKDVTITKRDNVFELRLKNNRLLQWYPPNTVLFHVTVIPTQESLDVLKKYVNSELTIEVQDDVVGVLHKKSWVPLFNSLQVDVDSDNVFSGIDPKWVAEVIQKYKSLKTKISEYVTKITPESLKLTVGELSSAKHAISTRCAGCRSFDSTHLKVHLDRKDLDLFLIYSAYDLFGKEAVGGAARLTWDLIDGVLGGKTDVKEVQDVMSKFFMNSLSSQPHSLITVPFIELSKPSRWRHGNWRQFRVQNNEFQRQDNIEAVQVRPGEAIALERVAEQAQIFRERQRRERLNAINVAARQAERQRRRFGQPIFAEEPALDNPPVNPFAFEVNLPPDRVRAMNEALLEVAEAGEEAMMQADELWINPGG